jgi:AcrR family transcriptional regulator
MDSETHTAQKRVPRRQRLIEVGMDLFCNRSYEDVAIDDIAAMADISKGLLYYYFPTKHDFYIAVVQYAAEQLLKETAPDPNLEPIQNLRQGLEAYFTYVEQHAQAYLALLRGGVGSDPQMAGIIDSVRQAYVRRIIQNLPEGTRLTPSHQIAISGWVGFVEATSVAWLEQRTMERDQLCNLALTAFAAIREWLIVT